MEWIFLADSSWFPYKVCTECGIPSLIRSGRSLYFSWLRSCLGQASMFEKFDSIHNPIMEKLKLRSFTTAIYWLRLWLFDWAISECCVWGASNRLARSSWRAWIIVRPFPIVVLFLRLAGVTRSCTTRGRQGLTIAWSLFFSSLILISDLLLELVINFNFFRS